jgi:acyl carrier protein
MNQAAFTIEEFRAILEDVLDREGLDIRSQTTANDVPGWDSLNHVRLLVRLEQAQGIVFSVGEVEAVGNVGDLLALIDRLKSAGR